MELPRRHRVRHEIPGHARLLTCGTFHRAPIFTMAWAADLFAEHLAHARDAMDFRLIAWVVMPDHFHLLIVPNVEACSAADVLRAIKEPVARGVLARLREMDHPLVTRLADASGTARLWQRGGGHDRNITNRNSAIEAARYIHANPVRKELCSRPEDWVWSSARWYAGERSGPVGIDSLR